MDQPGWFGGHAMFCVALCATVVGIVFYFCSPGGLIAKLVVTRLVRVYTLYNSVLSLPNTHLFPPG